MLWITFIGTFHLILRSHKVSKQWDLELFNPSEIWQPPRQQGCRFACQFSKECNNLYWQFQSFKASCDFTIQHHIGYWNGPLVTGSSRVSYPPEACVLTRVSDKELIRSDWPIPFSNNSFHNRFMVLCYVILQEIIKSPQSGVTMFSVCFRRIRPRFRCVRRRKHFCLSCPKCLS